MEIPRNHLGGHGLEFDLKYYILHVFRTSVAFKGKSSDHFKDIYKLKLLTNFNVNVTLFLGGIMNSYFNR